MPKLLGTCVSSRHSGRHKSPHCERTCAQTRFMAVVRVTLVLHMRPHHLRLGCLALKVAVRCFINHPPCGARGLSDSPGTLCFSSREGSQGKEDHETYPCRKPQDRERPVLPSQARPAARQERPVIERGRETSSSPAGRCHLSDLDTQPVLAIAKQDSASSGAPEGP